MGLVVRCSLGAAAGKHTKTIAILGAIVANFQTDQPTDKAKHDSVWEMKS